MPWTDNIGKVWQGDALQLMRSMPDKCVSLCLTDPPYNTTSLEWDVAIDLETFWKELRRLVKPKGAIVVTASQPFTTKLIASNYKDFRYCWVWNKKQSGSFLLAKHQPLKITEDVCVFSEEPHNYYPVMRKGTLRKKGGSVVKSELYESLGSESKVNDDYFPTNIIEASNAKKTERLHPTQKPVELMTYLIQTYSKDADDLIFDPFMGSWTTAVAAKQLGRRWIGAELSEKYCEIGKQRLRQEVLL